MDDEKDKSQQLLTPEQVMELLNIKGKDPKILYRLRIAKGKRHLKSIKIGNTVRYRSEDIEDWKIQNAKYFASTDWTDLSEDEIDSLDPAAGTGTNKGNLYTPD